MPKNENSYVVEGFAFCNEAEAEQAKKEWEGIKYIKEKADMSKPDVILQIYNRMVKEKMFVTSVGYAFLYDLQEYLRTNPSINDEDIMPIQIIHPSIRESLREEKQKHQEQLKAIKQKSDKKVIPDSEVMKKYKFSLVMNLILIISVVFMFIRLLFDCF